MIDLIRKETARLLAANKDGHGTEHVERVARLALRFADASGADKEKTEILALLHDADDYKLTGDLTEPQTNARRILREAGADEELTVFVTAELRRLGYHNALNGVHPLTEEGKAVFDADLCDAMGANGILRSAAFANSRGQPFFDPSARPRGGLTAETYMTGAPASAVVHMFEKILKLPSYLLTPAGRNEGKRRTALDRAFLSELFREENAEEMLKLLSETLSEDSFAGLPHFVCGKKRENVSYYERPGAYIVPRNGGRIGLIRKGNSLFFAGGGIEPGESNAQCLAREVLEETGRELLRLDGCFATGEEYKDGQTEIGFFHPFQYYYTGILSEPAAKPAESDHELVWFVPDEFVPEPAIAIQNEALAWLCNPSNKSEE